MASGMAVACLFGCLGLLKSIVLIALEEGRVYMSDLSIVWMEGYSKCAKDKQVIIDALIDRVADMAAEIAHLKSVEVKANEEYFRGRRDSTKGHLDRIANLL